MLSENVEWVWQGSRVSRKDNLGSLAVDIWVFRYLKHFCRPVKAQRILKDAFPSGLTGGGQAK